MEENKSFLRALVQADLDELTIRLGLYTHARLVRMFWRGDSRGPIPGGWEVADFVQAALKKALTRERIWKPSEQSLFEFLKDIISSDISHLALKSENRVESRLASRAPEADKNFAVAANLPGKESDWPDSDLRHEQEKKDILERVGENELDQNVVRCVLDQGLSSSGEIAAALNVRVCEVYKSKKRLRRKLQSLRTSTREESVDLPVDRFSFRNGDDQNAKL